MASTISFPLFRFLHTPSPSQIASSISASTAFRVPQLHAPTLPTRASVLSSNSMSQPVTDPETVATPTESVSENGDVVVQYVVLRRDLIDTWPLGSVVTQGCHASVSTVWSNKDDPVTIDYCSPEKIDSMHKVTLEVKGEAQIKNLSEKLTSGGIIHKMWIEQPENIPTCLATKPYPKSVVSSYFKKLKLSPPSGNGKWLGGQNGNEVAATVKCRLVWIMDSEGGSSKWRKSVGGGASMSSGSTEGVFDSKCRDDRDGVAPKCYYGVYAILYRSRTRNNPNRLFFGCPFFRQGSTPYCSFFMWLDKHCAQLGILKAVKDGAGAEDVNDHFAVIKVEDRVALLENKVAAMEKLRTVNWWIVVVNVVALLVIVYVMGS
ncbi:hypothetical protein PIB30_034853 [Stylosanthes scabra]|uniref:peptidyl-tRNA hydrolase n=1 Tax=Stylosanthes scabra TaxID=79078 RepID=A0ABU6ZC46_9FABA|nr:hypothetical protein [Stylosanthes scabra]